MKVYQTKTKPLPGTNYSEVYPLALDLFRIIKRRSKRRPHIRSAYFQKQKIFLDYFWEHLHQKNLPDRVRRLKLYPCALELIINSKFTPTSKENPNKKSEILHRFAGRTSDRNQFFVQIKEDKRTNQKYLVSIFPDNAI